MPPTDGMSKVLMTSSINGSKSDLAATMMVLDLSSP